MQIERVQPGQGQESVWDYPRPPKCVDCPEEIKIIVDNKVLAESTQSKRVLETSHPPVYYIPPSDISMEMLKATERETWCEWKGKAIYYDVISGGRRIANAAWTYPSPSPAFEAIRNYIAFYPQLMDSCFVGEEQVQPQAGGFYGGWVTSNIVGPFKGEPGTYCW